MSSSRRPISPTAPEPLPVKSLSLTESTDNAIDPGNEGVYANATKSLIGGGAASVVNAPFSGFSRKASSLDVTTSTRSSIGWKSIPIPADPPDKVTGSPIAVTTPLAWSIRTSRTDPVSPCTMP